MKTSDDYLIIGGGVIGFSIGISLLEYNPQFKVRIVEKESMPGAHASGRNSGVLHAGFYYSPDSLKAKFCKNGNFELKRLAAKHNVSVNNVGKVVVTKNLEEVERLENLFNRGIENGVDVELLNAKSLQKYEPLAQSVEKFLWSPTTSIADPKSILSAIKAEFLMLGGRIDFSTKIELVELGGEIVEKTGQFDAKYFINASGANADLIAKSLGIAEEYAMIPFMGQYRTIPLDYLPIRTLVYPVPHPINPFLGVHFTLTTDGKVKIGPTALPILGREQYSALSGWSMNDIWQTIAGVRSIAKGSSHSIIEMIKTEFPNLRLSAMVEEGAKLVPSASRQKNWARKPPGIRAQLVHLLTGTLEQDFKIVPHKNSMHVLNAVSPGWTSALPFGRYIVDQIQSKKKESI
jgi:L-2-hydroxyglutarate oxidase LhgO